MTEGIVSIKKTKPRTENVVTKQYRWFFRTPMNLEKLALLVQRVSGVGLLAYLFAHLFITGTITAGPAGAPGGQGVWDGVMAMLFNPIAHIGELLVIVGATFHAVNGIRVMLLEATSLVGHPIRPDYPYKTQSLGQGQKSILYAATIMAGLSLIVGVIFLWGLNL